MNKAQQLIANQARRSIVEALARAGEDPETAADVDSRCAGFDRVDAGACDIDLLLNDAQVQAALRELVTRVVALYQVQQQADAVNPDHQPR